MERDVMNERTRELIHTHTHTHSLTHSLTHTHTCTRPLVVSLICTERVRDALGAKKAHLSLLVALLKMMTDKETLEDLASVASLLVSHSARVRSKLIDCNVTDVMCRLVSKSALRSDAGFLMCVGCLGELAGHDKRLPVIVRVSGALKTVIAFAKHKKNEAKVLTPAVKLLSLVSTNATTAQAMHKAGLTLLLLTIVKFNGSLSNTELLRCSCVAISHLLSASSAACITFCKRKGIQIAKKLLLDWNASDKRNKHVALRRAFIAIFRAAGNYSTFCLMTLIGLENAGFLSVTEQQHTAFSPLAL